MSQEAFGVKELCWWLFASFFSSFSLSLWFMLQSSTVFSYRQNRGSILLAWFMLASFKWSPWGAKRISCGYSEKIHRHASFRLLHWYNSLYFNWFFSPLLFMSFSNSVFALFASIQGMCNIMRTFAMVRLGGSGSSMATVPADVSNIFVPSHISFMCSWRRTGIKIDRSDFQLWPNQLQLHLKKKTPPHAPNKLTWCTS